MTSTLKVWSDSDLPSSPRQRVVIAILTAALVTGIGPIALAVAIAALLGVSLSG